jgi:putative Mg2+ transporter-C (MgtC) family protein
MELDFLLRLSLATLLGALLGLEREMSRKAAGIRTYALVSLGAAIFAMLSEATYEYFLNTYGGTPNYDPSRIISQIVVGIGFLGAGMVVFHQEKIVGLTTAAGVWIAAAIGAAVGVRAYTLALLGTLLALFILIILRWGEDYLKAKWNARIGNG